MKILSLSDKVLDFVYSPTIVDSFPGVQLILGCGDLPYYYLEYVLDALRVPLFFVRGNHESTIEYGAQINRTAPQGGVDLHRRFVNFDGLLFGGFEGSLRYKEGPFMHTQTEMWWFVLRSVPRLLLNRLRYGRALDILVTHAPSWGIHDHSDKVHRGFRAFRWLLETFHPAYHFHGHVQPRPDEPYETSFRSTRVINAFGYRQTQIDAVGLVTQGKRDRSVSPGSGES